MASVEQVEEVGVATVGPEMNANSTGGGALAAILLFGFMWWASENFTNRR